MLKVWLPLDGDLHNQGISDYIITAVEASPTFTAGKIGQCYQRANTSSQITNGLQIQDNLLSTFGTTASVAVWVKPLGTHTHYNGTILSSGNWNSKRWAFGVSQDNSQVDVLCGGYNNYISCAVPVNQWTHLVSTFNNGVCKLYKNGTYVGEKTNQAAFNSDANWTGICRETYANGYFGFNECINDLRIYDHCLSAAEVKEIAQGLVLHYKLDMPQLNNPTTLTSEISSTAYNSSLRKYGYNNDSNLAKTSGTFQGKNCVKISTITAGQNAQPYVYFSNLFTSNGTNQPAYKKLIFEYYTTCPTTTWLNIYKLGSGTGTVSWKTINSKGIHNGIYTNSESGHNLLVEPNEWNYVEVILNGDTDANAEWGYCINGPTHTSNANYYFLYANIKLEASNQLKIQDSSGYNNNGITLNTINLSNNSPRYDISTNLVSGNSAINCGRGGMVTDSITVNLWMKSSAWANPVSCTESGGWNFEADGDYFRFPIYISGVGYKYGKSTHTRAQICNNQWHMLTGIYDRINGRVKIYVDGELDNDFDAQTHNNIAYANNVLWIGAEASGSQTAFAGNGMAGLFSDFRIYCTPLLDTDIKQLYNVGMKVDNSHNIHTEELIETSSNIWTRENLLKYRKSGNSAQEIFYKNGKSYIKTWPAQYYQNITIDGGTSSCVLHHEFKPNTQYIFDMWMDSSESTSLGAFSIYYTDGTSSTALQMPANGNEEWVHKQYISDSGKSILRMSQRYGTNTPICTSLDSYIGPLDTFQIKKTAQVKATTFSEDSSTTKIIKSGYLKSSQLIER